MTDDESKIIKPVRQNEIVSLEIHHEAEKLTENLIMVYATALLVQAKTLAYQRRDDVVLQTHVNEALDILQRERKQKRWRNWLLALGGVFLGTFAQGFITELTSQNRPVPVAIYVVLGFLGIVLMVAGTKQ